MECSKCKKWNRNEAKFCFNCGFDLSKKNCQKCGSTNWKERIYCNNCGEKLETSNNSTQWKPMESTVFGTNTGASRPLNTPNYSKAEGIRVTPSTNTQKKTFKSVLLDILGIIAFIALIAFITLA